MDPPSSEGGVTDNSASSDAPSNAVEDTNLLVQQGYDKIALRYLDWASQLPSPRTEWLERLLKKLPTVPRAKALELGCGAGIPATVRLAQHVDLIANDISGAQIALAKKHIPGVKFLHCNMTALSFPDRSFDAVVAFYTIFHLQRLEQETMLKRICSWLKDDGLLLISMGAMDIPASINPDWLGAQMYWSSYGAEQNKAVMIDAGFTILESEVMLDHEDGVDVPFLWVLAQRKADP